MFRTGQFTPQLKLLYHIDRVQEWLDGKDISPVLVEFDLSNACNHKCKFCTFAYIENNQTLDKSVALDAVWDLSNAGVKAINWTGGGEPLVHPDFCEIAQLACDRGIKQGIFTNGSLINDETIETLLTTHEWVRVSLDAGTNQTFFETHGIDHFDRIIQNVVKLVERKRTLDSKTDIGIGFVITPDNFKDIEAFSNLVKSVGVDYGQLKPCINNFLTNWQIESQWWQKEVVPLLSKVMQDNKKIVVNDYKFKELMNEELTRTYDKCYGHLFVPCIGADGNVWICTHMRDIRGYSIGNLYDKPFGEIWNSPRHKEIAEEIDFSKCQFCCKNHEINKALYAVKHDEVRKHGDFL